MKIISEADVYIVKYKYKAIGADDEPCTIAHESMPYPCYEEAEKLYLKEMKRLKKLGVDFYKDIIYRYIDTKKERFEQEVRDDYFQHK